MANPSHSKTWLISSCLMIDCRLKGPPNTGLHYVSPPEAVSLTFNKDRQLTRYPFPPLLLPPPLPPTHLPTPLLLASPPSVPWQTDGGRGDGP
jgi:hypothetical protein